MNWGIWDKKLNTKEMDNIIHLCLENKITTFDHADIMAIIPLKLILEKP